MTSLQQKKTADRVELQVERYFTRAILSGELPAGFRLPSNRALAAEWSTSCSSIQRALANMTAAGLIERATSRGTFVRSRQERAMIGILFGPNLIDHSAWYYRSLWERLSNEIDSEFLASRVYSGLASHEAPARVQSQIKHLLMDQKHFSFAGFIEISTAQMDAEYRPTLWPKVVFDHILPETDMVHDDVDCGREIIASIHRRGLRRVTLLTAYSEQILAKRTAADALISEAAKYPSLQMEVIGHSFNTTQAPLEERVHEAMMAYLARTKRSSLPQALIMTNDGVVGAVIMALLKHGIRIPEQIKLYVVTSENARVFYSVPINRYCRLTSEHARRLVDLLKARIAGNAEDRVLPMVLTGRMEEEA